MLPDFSVSMQSLSSRSMVVSNGTPILQSRHANIFLDESVIHANIGGFL